MSSKEKNDEIQDSWTEEEKKYHLLAEQNRKHHERLAQEECEAKRVQEKKLFDDIKTKQLFEMAKEEAKNQEALQIGKESKYQSTNRENQLKFLDEQERRLEDTSKEEIEKKAILAQKVKNQEVIVKKEFERLQELENQKLAEGEKSKLDKEGRALVFDDESRKEEEKNALLENEKRLQKQKHHHEEKEKVEKIEMERASFEIENRFKTALLVKEHEKEFAKMLDDTHQAKTQDEALKGKRWEEEKVNEDLEMEERIKARNALQKQKLLEYDKIREETEKDAKAIESNIIKKSKEYKERRLNEIDIEKFHEDERRKKEEGVRKREVFEKKRKEIDSKKLEIEKEALAKEKEKRIKVVLKQEAELSRFEKELKQGEDERTRREWEKKEQIQKQIEQEEKEASDMLQRQKLRNQERDTKKDAIAKETENFVATQASKRKNLDESKKEVEKMVSLHDEYLKKEENTKQMKERERLEKEKQRMESEKEKEEAEILRLLDAQKLKKRDQKEDKQEDENVFHEQRKQQESKVRKTKEAAKILSDERDSEEERLRLEGIKRRELQIKLQQEELIKQQDAEMELLMKSRKVKARADEKDGSKPKTKSEKKGIFGALFQKRSPKE